MTMETATQTELLPEVQEFLSKEIHGAVIGGEEVFASDGGTFETHDPGSGEKLATVANLTAEDVERAVAAAQTAFDESDWARMPEPCTRYSRAGTRTRSARRSSCRRSWGHPPRYAGTRTTPRLRCLRATSRRAPFS